MYMVYSAKIGKSIVLSKKCCHGSGIKFGKFGKKT